jgi:hypothetical protein
VGISILSQTGPWEQLFGASGGRQPMDLPVWNTL